nr:hypothetical protein BaRGS_030673 [Batillaria attramentaria]
MSNRFSARASCMLGAFIFAAGVIISGFAPNVPFLFLSYGLLQGISDTVARILAGAILDFEKVRPFRPIAYNGVIFVITVLSFLSPFMTNFVEFAFLFGLYGALTGMYVSQKSVILVDILGQEKLSSSFGLMICFQGLLKDIFGQYDEAFFLGGAAMAAAGGLMIVSNVYRVASERRRLARLERDKAQA